VELTRRDAHRKISLPEDHEALFTTRSNSLAGNSAQRRRFFFRLRPEGIRTTLRRRRKFARDARRKTRGSVPSAGVYRRSGIRSPAIIARATAGSGCTPTRRIIAQRPSA